LSLFGRLPPHPLDGSSCRRPKTCTGADLTRACLAGEPNRPTTCLIPHIRPHQGWRDRRGHLDRGRFARHKPACPPMVTYAPRRAFATHELAQKPRAGRNNFRHIDERDRPAATTTPTGSPFRFAASTRHPQRVSDRVSGKRNNPRDKGGAKSSIFAPNQCGAESALGSFAVRPTQCPLRPITTKFGSASK
jgi:hypothetical protein